MSKPELLEWCASCKTQSYASFIYSDIFFRFVHDGITSWDRDGTAGGPLTWSGRYINLLKNKCTPLHTRADKSDSVCEYR